MLRRTAFVGHGQLAMRALLPKLFQPTWASVAQYGSGRAGSSGTLAGSRGGAASIAGRPPLSHKAVAPRRAAFPAAAAAASTAGLVSRHCAASTDARNGAEEAAWQTTASGLQYRDVLVGTGEAPVKGQTVYVHYTGRLESGEQFDSSIPRGQPLEFQVGKGMVIAGWDEGILSMRMGGKRQLRIPPALGYGQRGAPPVIPPNATLLFDCELVSLGSKPLLSRLFGG
mmetsp:Transcript_135708/g.378047  ORF Transcript_135708/g.378047 Transcript_135708/m.378047 type:complete len:227 (+) Transcript_135708:97-777(+)